MDYFIYAFESCFFAALIIEVLGMLVIVWGIRNEEKLSAFEDRIILIVKESCISSVTKLVKIAGNIFIFFYRTYRRMKRRLLNRLLRQFHLKAIRSEQESCNEILSRR